MKVIDLLVKRANSEEMPKLISYRGERFMYSGNDYFSLDKVLIDDEGEEYNPHFLYDMNITNINVLNDEVEIIEDKPEKIEKISYILDMEKYVPKMTDYNNSSDIVQKICNRTMLLEQKLNGTIYKLNYLLEKSDKE